MREGTTDNPSRQLLSQNHSQGLRPDTAPPQAAPLASGSPRSDALAALPVQASQAAHQSSRGVLARSGTDRASGARSLYIHTPFCVHKCHYCDFYSFVDTRDQQHAFVERLCKELRALAPHAATIDTIFVGGGTPSLLQPALWKRLLVALHDLFDLRNATVPRKSDLPGRQPSAPATPFEFTVECNPESVTPELLGILRDGGVNRVSIGAQSFNAAHLATLERWHRPENVARAVDLARAAGIERQSIDLIFAVPGQTLEQWRSDLSIALSLGTTHLSCYDLTYEPNTAMTIRLRRGEFLPAPEDLEADMFALTGDTLANASLQRYEVSNYAVGGINGPHACRHNLAYWRQQQWLAAGPSASGNIFANPADPLAGSFRWKNTPNLGRYLEQDDDGYAPAIDIEPPSPARALRERIMTGLRLSAGLHIPTILQDARTLLSRGHLDARTPDLLASEARGLIGDGLLDPEQAASGVWSLSAQGWMLADFAARRLMACVREP
jgi:oxygen-independent coproporphyrinogen-3 oxidase